MAAKYRINLDSQVPIYQQLVDEIRSAIKLGELSSGQQLPTVLTMAEELNLARGTIQKAYDELERLGLIEKVQGRGTFVCYQHQSSNSRKELAMQSIDQMLDNLAELGFSLSETEIYLNLKLRERESRVSKVKVAVVECNPETLSQLSEQLRSLEGIELYSYLLSHVQDYPYNLGEEMDLVVTTATHAEYIQSILPNRKKIARIALRLSPKSMAQIVKLQANECVGILGCSDKFGALLYAACGIYTEQVRVESPEYISDNVSMRAYLKDKTAILVPKDYEKIFSQEQLSLLKKFEKSGKVIPCSYEMDEGSYLFLQERVNRLREKKPV